MKTVTNSYILVSILVTAALAASGQTARTDDAIAADFANRVRQYTSRLEVLESQLPALPKQATAEQIAVHKKELLKKVLADRRRTRRSVIFTAGSRQLIRKIIAAQYPGREKLELRKELTEAENKTVPIKVNGIYPEAAELLEMPPTLLLALPELPKHVRYRFVGTNLLIVDRESHLIVDYMKAALQ